MIKTFCSSYIPLNSIADAQTLRQDFDLYNKMLREMLLVFRKSLRNLAAVNVSPASSRSIQP